MSSVSSAISPLTTTFTPPAWCLDNIYAAQSDGTTFFGLGTPCGNLNDSCFPSQVTQAAPASLFDLQPFLYSPGISCPSGYTTATTTQLAATITGAACCPSGLAPSGIVCEGFPNSPFTATGCDSLTTTYSDSASTFTASAALIILAWESSDLAQAGSAATSTGILSSGATQTQGSAISTATSNISKDPSSNQTVASSGGALPTIQIPTSSISNSTLATTSGAFFRPRAGWHALILCCGLAVAALLS